MTASETDTSAAGRARHILVGLDGSPRAEGVLAYAVTLARAMGAKLVLFRAFDVPAEMRMAWPLPDEPLEESLRREAQLALEKKAQTVPTELVDRLVVEMGAPWEAVCEMARKVNAELVVVGSHGFSGVDHILGTTAARIVNHIDRPVLVVRPIPPP